MLRAGKEAAPSNQICVLPNSLKPRSLVILFFAAVDILVGLFIVLTRFLHGLMLTATGVRIGSLSKSLFVLLASIGNILTIARINRVSVSVSSAEYRRGGVIVGRFRRRLRVFGRRGIIFSGRL